MTGIVSGRNSLRSLYAYFLSEEPVLPLNSGDFRKKTDRARELLKFWKLTQESKDT